MSCFVELGFHVFFHLVNARKRTGTRPPEKYLGHLHETDNKPLLEQVSQGLEILRLQERGAREGPAALS